MKLKKFFSHVFSQVDLFCMQSSSDAVRIMEIGAPRDRILVTGNLKFDQKLPAPTPNPVKMPNGSKVITAGSTHRGEEAALLEVFRRLREKYPELILIVAPRHPERFDEVESLTHRAGFECRRRTRLKGEVKDVLLLDTIGELRSFYEICDIAFVGGSLVKVGGHNLLEPAAMKKPVIFSRYMFNFKEISEALISAGGGILVKDKEELYTESDKLLSNRTLAQEIGMRAFSVIEANSGAATRTIDAVGRLIGENG
jgi:3-deoxy-D-manno-octulosonic-acid transferase